MEIVVFLCGVQRRASWMLFSEELHVSQCLAMRVVRLHLEEYARAEAAKAVQAWEHSIAE